MKSITAYQTSRDYEKLFELMQKSSIICIVDYLGLDSSRDAHISRDVAQTLCRKEDYQISARGIGYIWAETKEDFVNQCARYNVEFIAPNL